MNTTQKVILSGLIGAAAGATAGILMAPDEGKKTRKKIAKSADDVKKSVEDMVDETKESLKDFAQNGVDKMTA